MPPIAAPHARTRRCTSSSPATPRRSPGRKSGWARSRRSPSAPASARRSWSTSPAVTPSCCRRKIERYGVNCWLVNTGWVGGPYGVGKRISIGYTAPCSTRRWMAACRTYRRCAIRSSGSKCLSRATGSRRRSSIRPAPGPIRRVYTNKYRQLAARFIENFKKFEVCPPRPRSWPPVRGRPEHPFVPGLPEPSSSRMTVLAARSLASARPALASPARPAPALGFPGGAAFVRKVGFCLFWPSAGFDLPNLLQAIAGNDRPLSSGYDDPAIGRSWAWKDQALDRRWWYYGKLLKRRATLVSLDILPAFYALSENFGDAQDYLVEYQEGRLSAEAKGVYEALLEQGPLDAIRLRQEARLAASSAKSRFDRALVDLQAGLKVLPVGVSDVGAWHYAVRIRSGRPLVSRSPRARPTAHNREARRRILVRHVEHDRGRAAGDRPGPGLERHRLQRAVAQGTEDGTLVEVSAEPGVVGSLVTTRRWKPKLARAIQSKGSRRVNGDRGRTAGEDAPAAFDASEEEGKMSLMRRVDRARQAFQSGDRTAAAAAHSTTAVATCGRRGAWRRRRSVSGRPRLRRPGWCGDAPLPWSAV